MTLIALVMLLLAAFMVAAIVVLAHDPASLRPHPSATAQLVSTATRRSLRVPVTGLSIGRSSDCGLTIDSIVVSRRHADIRFESGRWVLHDLDSHNGTLVNNQPVLDHTLGDGDRVRIGPEEYVFRVGRSRTAPSRSKPPPRPQPPVPPERVTLPQLRDLVPISRGGHAVVFRATRADGQGLVAVKFLRQDSEYLKRKFNAEGALLERTLDHPHIVKAFDSGQVDGTFYIVMEYCAHGSLRERLPVGKALLPSEIVSLIGQTCSAVSHAHGKGVIHRDLKPENMLLDEHDILKVADFGIAKIAGSQSITLAGTILGTPPYMSYEQANGVPVTPRSDIYSLGVIMYEMATGHVPFSGEPLEVVHKHLTEPPIPPRRINSALPVVFENAIMKALQKDEGKRFRSAQALAGAIGYRDDQDPIHHLAASGKRDHVRRPALVPSARLAYKDPTGRMHVLPLSATDTPLGRTVLGIDDPSMSRQHAVIRQHGTGFVLEDQNSKFGTFIDDRRIRGPTRLRHGQRIRIGSTVFLFESTNRLST